MLLKTQKYSIPLLSALVTVLLMSVFLWYGIFLEDNETIVAAINYGVLGKMGSDQFFSDYLTFLLPPLYFLSREFQSIPVFGIYKLFNTFISFFLLIYVSFRLLSATGAGRLLSITYVLFLFALFFDSIFQLHCVRHSVILSFGSLMLYRTHWEQKKQVSRAAIIFFLLALLNRMHAASLVLVSFLIYDVLLTATFLHVIKKYLLPIILAMALICLYQLHGKCTNNLGRYIEAHFEYALLEKPHIVPLHRESSSRDSVKYVALKNYFFTDSAQFTKPYFHHFIQLQPTTSFIFSNQNVNAIINDLKKRVHDSFALLAVIGISLLATIAWGKRWSFVDQLLYFSSSLVVPVLLLLFLTNELKERFFNPYLGSVAWVISLNTITILLKSSSDIFSKKLLRYVLFSLFVFVATWQFQYYRDTHQQLEARNKEFYVHSSYLRSATNLKPTLFFIGSDIPLSNDPLYRTPETLYANLATFDGGYLTFYSYCVERFRRLFGHHPGNFSEHARMFKKNIPIQAYILPERISVIANYFDCFYGVHLKFEEMCSVGFGGARIYLVTAN